ncbi:MAG: AI-2E family transporter, partial [Paludibacteraceae bacterium]|nr:AI-2E family transporter [Paludibacteraceae bacterium]
MPFFVSFLLAYLLDPVVEFVQHKCRVKFRGLSVAIVLLLFVGLMTLAVYLLIPAIGREVQAAAVGVEQYFAQFDADRYFTP